MAILSKVRTLSCQRLFCRRWPAQRGQDGCQLGSLIARGQIYRPSIHRSKHLLRCFPQMHHYSTDSKANHQRFSPDDGKAVFASVSSMQLCFTWFLLQLCKLKSVVSVSSGIVNWAAAAPSNLASKAVFKLVRLTAFFHFCGGENLQACAAVAKRLHITAAIRCIFDWSVEETSDINSWDNNAQHKVETLLRAKEVLGCNAAFMPVKLTSLLSPDLLERISRIVDVSRTELMQLEEWSSQLHAEDQEELEGALCRLRRICEVARSVDIPILFDAEQSARQPAVHLIAQKLQLEFNKGRCPVIYDTIQMYLQQSSVRLQEALHRAERGGYVCAIKLVRGAYWQQEMALGTVHSSKEQTDVAYHAAVTQLLEIIAASTRHEPPHVSVLLATHNRASLTHATNEMDRLGLARNHRDIHFAQILGMVDNLTVALSLAGYNALKLVVFGEVQEVMPWLLRRVQENHDAFGAQAAELPILTKELQRRFFGRLTS